MARDLKLAMTLVARDQGSKVLRQSVEEINRQLIASKRIAEDVHRTELLNQQQSVRASRTLQQEYQRAASARETLGIRSERTIQREIFQTQAAYMRLLRTGSMSAQEQSRAFDAMTRKVAGLRNELNGANQALSRFERVRNWGGNATAIAGGVMAAGAVVMPSVRNQMGYEQRLAMMANTAFAEEGVGGRRKGMDSMDKLIRRAVGVGGGTKESAAETLDTLLASGAVDYSSAERLLPMLQKYSTATGADSKDLAQIAIRLKQSFGVSDAQVPTAINMAIKSGQLGSFELKDQAKWLPQQMAAAGSLGMRGLNDLSVLLGLNQASAITAGTTDEAGNNVVNLLAKINSQDAANAASRIKYHGKGIDLPGSLVAARGKGMNALDAFSGIVDKIVGNNPAYKKLETQLNNTSDGSARREIMDSQAKLLEGSAVGQIIADRQALMALIAYRANKKYARDVIKGVNQEQTIPVNQQAGEQNFELMEGTNLYKVNQLNNTRDFAQMDSVKSLSDITGKLSQELSEYAGAYPGLTKAMAGAEIAIKGMTAAAWAFAGIKILGSVAGSGAGGAAAGAATAAAGGAGLFGRLARIGGKTLAPLAIWQAANDAPLFQLHRGDAEARSRLTSGQDKDSASQMRDTMKSQPGLLDAWDEVKSWWSSPTSIKTPASANGYPVPPFAQVQSPQMPPIIINSKLELDGRVLAEATNEVNSQSAARGPQGGPH
ncbi:phage tail tape measure protein [Pantoea stewartii]|uniref:phage tail tape measure protein n=1 Tax=Pantoea stewartii TaxID=66269 RepID=UPI003367FF7B